MRDGLATPADLTAWLSINHIHCPRPVRAVAASQLDEFRGLRSVVRELLGAVVDGHWPAPSAVGLLDDHSAAAPERARLDSIDQIPQRTAVEVADDPTDVALRMVGDRAKSPWQKVQHDQPGEGSGPARGT